MPAREEQDDDRGSVLTKVAFWGGAALASLAALLMLISSGAGALRIAAVLAIIAVVLIGLSVMLRPDANRVRAELEETLLDEIDLAREDGRKDIASAARATHKSFSDKLQVVQQQLDSLRAQVDAARKQLGAGTEKSAAPGRASVPAPTRAPEPARVGGGVVRHTETVQVTTRHTVVDPHGDDDRGTVYGGTASVYGQRQADPRESMPGSRRAEAARGWQEPREESWTEQRLRDRLRDSNPDLFGPGGLFGARPAESGRRDSGQIQAVPAHAASTGSYEQRDDYGRRDDGRGSRARERDESTSDVADDGRWSDMRAGDRWASVHSDDRGRELRMGERRAAMHRDEAGSEVRIEDRWAAVRREEARRSAEQRRYEDARPAYPPSPEPRSETRRERREREERGAREVGDGWSTGSRHAYQDDGELRWTESGWPQTGATPALPPGGAPVPTWTQDWRGEAPAGQRADPRGEYLREPVREPRRDDRWAREEPRTASPRPRRIDFETTDDRWR